MPITALAAVLTLSSFLGAQEPVAYLEGDVNRLLAQAKEQQRPAVVLFNFNLETG